MQTKKFATPELTDGVRINKYMADSGMCSRREADRLVEEGKVYVDGVKAVNGTKVKAGQKVTVEGQQVDRDQNQVLIAFYKPVGIVCTTDSREPDNVVDFINYGKRIYPIGRLDKDSEGLLLLTNDGDIVNKILRAGNNHEKEYEVVVNRPITPEFLKGMAQGVPILDTVTKPCKIEPTGKQSFNIILTQGLNRQIRRMCEYFDYRVVALKRVRIMHINIGHLKPGAYRNLTPEELTKLKEVLVNSSKLAAKDQRKDVKTAQTKAVPKRTETTQKEKSSLGPRTKENASQFKNRRITNGQKRTYQDTHRNTK